jgi:hypothetical protein
MTKSRHKNVFQFRCLSRQTSSHSLFPLEIYVQTLLAAVESRHRTDHLPSVILLPSRLRSSRVFHDALSSQSAFDLCIVFDLSLLSFDTVDSLLPGSLCVWRLRCLMTLESQLPLNQGQSGSQSLDEILSMVGYIAFPPEPLWRATAHELRAAGSGRPPAPRHALSRPRFSSTRDYGFSGTDGW